MAEEFGFVGTVLIIGLLVIIILRSLKAAREAGDRFGALIAYSYAVMIFFQAAVNIGVNLNLMPVSGLPLPFLSYGGTSLLVNMASIGILMNIGKPGTRGQGSGVRGQPENGNWRLATGRGGRRKA